MHSDDAFKCFMGTEMDILIIDNFYLVKSDQDATLLENYENKYNLINLQKQLLLIIFFSFPLILYISVGYLKNEIFEMFLLPYLFLLILFIV